VPKEPRQVLKEHRVIQDFLDQQELKVQLQEHKDQQEHKERQGPKELKEFLQVLKVILELKEL
jgi:hypothetical protein